MPYRAGRHRTHARKPTYNADAERERNQAPHRRLYKTAAWQKFRLYKLASNPICADCGRAPSLDVDHLRGLAAHPEDLCSDEWTEAVCHRCHARREAARRRGRGE